MQTNKAIVHTLASHVHQAMLLVTHQNRVPRTFLHLFAHHPTKWCQVDCADCAAARALAGACLCWSTYSGQKKVRQNRCVVGVVDWL